MSNSSDTKKPEIRWIPLESNPDVLNKIIHNHGVDKKWGFVDICGFDHDALTMIPRPTAAVIFLFPGTPAYDDFREKDEAYLKLHKQKVSENVIHFTQTIKNACGMMALLHSLSNNRHLVGNGLFKGIFDATQKMNANDRGEYLESCSELANVHYDSACSGQSHTPDVADACTNHFISFVEVDGDIYELDGGRPFPVNHGKCEDFVKDTARIMREFIARDPNDNDYSAIAFAKLED